MDALEISAVILAGGESQRLGVDKSLLVVNGEWLLKRILNIMSTLSDDLLVVANARPEFARLPARVVPDAYPGTGPLGGIYSGLQAMHYEQGLFLACDMPLLNIPLLRYMILLSADFDVVIPSVRGKTEPLHAVYSKACTHPIEELLRRGERRIVSFFSEVRVRYVTENEVDVFDPEHLSFFNINTLDDLTLAKSLIHRQPPIKLEHH